MAKLQGGSRIYGNLTIDSNLLISGTQNAVSQNSGAVQILGGVGIGGNLYVGGNLVIQGTTTTVNSTTLDITDLNITVAKGAASAAAANGAGLTVDGAGATFTYNSTTDTWNFNKGINSANITATTISTTATTGALTVAGGVGIGGNLNVGGNARIISDTGHILVGDRIRDANINNVWVQGVAVGLTGDRPFTLIDSSAVVKIVRPGNDAGLELQSWDSTIATQNAYWDLAAVNANGNLIIRDRTVGGAGTAITIEKITGNTTITSNLRVNKDITFSGNAIHADSGDPVGYIRYLDDIADRFDGITRKFLITYDDGTAYNVNNPLQLQVYVGGIIVPPARYIRDYFNLPEVAVFDHGFYLQRGLDDANAVVISTVTTNTAGNIGNVQISSGGNTIVFATAPSSSMDFQAFVRTNSDPQPAFKFKQTPFTALNIMLGP